MRVAVLSESSADEAAIRILLNGILGEQTQDAPPLPLRSRGWPYVLRVLPTIIKFLHYRTDAEALAVIVDSDDSLIHQDSHERSVGHSDCRLCELRRVSALEMDRLTAVPNRNTLKVALGLAVPAIEAWYLCGLDTQVNEATWARGLLSERISYARNTLKKSIYGTERPTIEIETRHAIEAATRLVADLTLIEQLFPVGFGSFARDVRAW